MESDFPRLGCTHEGSRGAAEAGAHALALMCTTLLTFHADTFPLKAVASWNTARAPPPRAPARQPPHLAMATVGQHMPPPPWHGLGAAGGE
eukprot:COSAG01_NODE_10254_length_2209_cov_2.554976_3_plen_91_part_00